MKALYSKKPVITCIDSGSTHDFVHNEETGYIVNPSPTKLAQAINWGLPIISTHPGNRGYDFSKIKPLTVNTLQEMSFQIKEYTFNFNKLNSLAILTHKIALEGPKIEDLGKDLLSNLYFSKGT